MLQWLMVAEQSFLLWLQDSVRNDVLNSIFIFITTLGNGGMIWIAMGLGLMIPKKTRKIGIFVLISLLGSLLINNMLLKNVVARTRPYDAIAGLTSLVGPQSDYSFPSGHTASSFAAAIVLLKGLPKKYGVPAVILACLIGFSRLYVGVHYPTDVICGAISGIAIALISYQCGELFWSNRGHKHKKVIKA